MVILGFKQPLETKDLWSLKKQDEAGTIVTRFLKNWEKDKAAARCSIEIEFDYFKSTGI